MLNPPPQDMGVAVRTGRQALPPPVDLLTVQFVGVGSIRLHGIGLVGRAGLLATFSFWVQPQPALPRTSMPSAQTQVSSWSGKK